MMTERTGHNSLEELRKVIRTQPIVDNHAHNILRPNQQKKYDFLSITTEAAGSALEDTPKSLSHLRAAKQLRRLYDLPSEASWEDILKKRQQLVDKDYDRLIKQCLEGTACICIDDGINTEDVVYPYREHDRYTTTPNRRIVRIETVATRILSALHQNGKLPIGVAVADEEACAIAWVGFIQAFEAAIAAAIDEDDIVGFKSVVCYRTGLDVRTGRDIEVTEDGLRSFRRQFLPDCVAKSFRIQAKGMNDALVVSTCKLIAAGGRQSGEVKPLQFHTGLGDNDISLLHSNPAHLQPLIKAFPQVPFVLLHSSYPYTREAGYLATCYKNVYLDIGEVFPMVSRDGQEKIVRQALELSPWNKVLWSTDGHHYPETYWLANLQMREAMEKVMTEYIEHEDLTIDQAIQAVKDILFNNSNELYNLRLDEDGQEDGDDVKARPQDLVVRSADAQVNTNMKKDTLGATEGPFKTNPLTTFRRLHPNVRLVFVEWLDYMATLRTRITPIAEFERLVKTGGRIGVSYGNLGTLQNDASSSVCNPVGQVYAQPDLQSLRPAHYKNSATVIASYTADSGESLDLCPRSGLIRLVSRFKEKYDIDFLVGFEIEINFLKCTGNKDQPYEPLTSHQAWASMSDEQYVKALPLLADVESWLRWMNIPIQQLHSEAGAGQYEFVLPPLPLVEAVDTLVQARQCIQNIAAEEDLRATMHPQPFPGIGTAAHAHISLNSSTLSEEELNKIEMSFFASVMDHLGSICAFTMPQAASYARVADDHWTSGTWVCWGSQNRETPLRRVEAGRWEIRCLDGLANMYLALGAILGAGLMGSEEGKEMMLKDCPGLSLSRGPSQSVEANSLMVNPTKLSADQKAELGIKDKLPSSFEEALDALEKDEAFKQALSPGLAEHFIAMKQDEQKMLEEMLESERRVWLIERY